MVCRRAVLRLATTAATASLAGCEALEAEPTEDGTGTTGRTEPTPSASLRSRAFAAGGEIPARFTCAGENVSPPLTVENVPEDAGTMALIVDDPDAGESPFTHWLLWNVPADTTSIPADVPATETVEALDGARQGTNDFGDIGYGGPCPPEDDPPHAYRFTLHVLENRIRVGAGARRQEVVDAMADKRLARARLTASFGR